LDDMSNARALAMLKELQRDGIVRRIGVNTHYLEVMNHLVAAPSLLCIDDLMVDFNILQNNREGVVKGFAQSRPSRKAWAGTALCQGFLVQSLLSMYIRTRSIGYVARALLNPPTRTYLKKASPLRRMLRKSFGDNWFKVPLSYVLNQDYVSYVPMGMLSKASIAANVDIALFPVDGSLIKSFLHELPGDLFVGDVFN
jgi:aryl-alcohol dehydrogenase-like predicted oxidoreductase